MNMERGIARIRAMRQEALQAAADARAKFNNNENERQLLIAEAHKRDLLAFEVDE